MNGKGRHTKSRERWLLLLLALLLLPQLALGATTAPVATRLLTLPEQSFAGGIASDSTGNLFVADLFNKVVRSYTAKGALRYAIPLKYAPTCLAVSPSNNLYVGQFDRNSGKGRVDVFSPAAEAVGSYDCKKPAAMTFISSGELLLADGYELKRLDGQFNVLQSTGGYGRFVDISSVAANAQTGEIFVLDRGAMGTEGSYSNTPVWRVQVLDAAMNVIRNYSSYGYGKDGKIGTASSMTLDNQGRVYIADHVQSVIMVFDGTGAFISSLFDASQPINNPNSVTFANDRLYVASMRAAGSAYVLGIDGFSQLSVSPQMVEFEYQAGMSTTKDNIITLSNSGGAGGSLGWTASADAGWLSMAPSSGQIAGGGSQQASLSIDPAKMAKGLNTGKISIQYNGGTEEIMVKVTLRDNAVLTVTPAVINVKKIQGQAAPAADLAIQIANDLSGARTWHAEVSPSAAGWLGISKTDGISNMVPAPQVTVGDMPTGSYSGIITITSADCDGSPATVTVNLEVVKATSISVTTSIPEASFTISGPANYSGTGKTSYLFENAPEGTYTITYGDVSGYLTPRQQTEGLVATGAISFNGNYVDLRRRVNIVASYGPKMALPADVAVFTSEGKLVSNFNPFPGFSFGATTAVGDIDGDGVMDIVVGAGGAAMPAVVTAVHSDGSPIGGLKFTAYKSNKGVNVAAADFDASGTYEIVTGDRKTTFVRIFAYSRDAVGSVADTGVYFEAYRNSETGVNVAVADLDGDGRPELVTVPEGRDVVAPVANIYKIDTSAGIGGWKAVQAGSFTACPNISATSLTTGDIDGNGSQEILVVCMGSSGSEVREYTATGNLIRVQQLGSREVEFIAAGDTSMDGSAEIILGSGGVNSVKIIDATTGTAIRNFTAFRRGNGVRVSVGNLGY